MDRYRALSAFVRVAEHGGFAPAARALGLSTSAVSRLIMELEDWLDAQLFHRTTRHVSLTDAGREYLERCKQLVAGFDELETAAHEQLSDPHGRVRITAPVFMGKRLLGPLIPGFLERFPLVTIDLLLLDRVINLVDEGFDLALRLGNLDDSSLVARRIGEFEISLVAAPGYLKRAGTPKSASELKLHNCLVDTAPRHGNRWPLGAQGKSAQRVNGNLVANSGELIRELALAGTGIALLPTFFVAPDIKAGRLKAVLKSEVPKTKAGIFLVYPQTRHLSRAVRAFIDYVVEQSPVTHSAFPTR